MSKNSSSSAKIVGLKGSQSQAAIAKQLNQLLADSYLLNLKTQNAHWNATGSNFFAIHKLTEEQYNEQSQANDEIAERIRALGQNVNASFSFFTQASSITEDKPNASTNQLLQNLIKAQEQAAETAAQTASIADQANDIATADLATERVAQHQKNAWLLRSVQA